MKKLLSIAALSFALVGFAEDQFLYWMVADNANLISAGAQYSAKIIPTSDESNYLHLYSTPDKSTQEFTGGMFAFEGGDSLKVYALLPEGAAQSFIVELYADGGVLLGRTDGIYTISSSAIADYIWAGGMSTPPAGAYEVKTFRAIPEPTSGLLLLLGIAGLALKRKRA